MSGVSCQLSVADTETVNIYGNIVGRGLAPAEQANCFIIVYGNLCRARRSEAYEAVVNDDTVRRQSRRETEPQRDPRRAEQACGLGKRGQKNAKCRMQNAE